MVGQNTLLASAHTNEGHVANPSITNCKGEYLYKSREAKGVNMFKGPVPFESVSELRTEL